MTFSFCIFTSFFFTSVGLCDVDEKGVQYVLLCRVILGNMEAIEPGSQESFPSSEIYDSGVDDCLNPKCYVMWPSHLSTHIWLEYLVSFKLAPQVQNYLLGLKGLWFHPSPKEVATDICALQPVTCESGQGPTTPWISFKVLFEVIQDKISSVARELLLHHYEELKESKITREEMVKKMMIIVGEKILLEALKKLHHCPSLWYKSRVEAVSNDPTKTAAEHLDDTGRNCLTPSANHGDSHAPNGNHGNSHAPNAVTEQSKALSTKGCGTLAADMVPKGHDFLAASSMPETSSPAVAIFRDSPGAEPEGIVSPIQIMSPGISATRCSKTQDSFVGRMPPIVCEGLLRTSGKPVSLGMEICNSVAPTRGHPGYASLAPTNGSKSHGIFAPDFAPSPKVCESIVPRLALGNSKSTGMKRFNSAPRMTPEGQKFPSLGIASQSPDSVKDLNRLTSVVVSPVHAKERGNSTSMSTDGCDPLALSITPKSHDPPASSKEPKYHESATADTMLQSYHHQAQDAATKVHNAPTSITGEPKSSGSILDDSSHVVRAADILVALSTPREKGGH
uniref:PARP catalytic domain-containing protein n=1 Tax=Arundo donax TaxID=35708 RepID=A0A0A9DJE4_ARUDO